MGTDAALATLGLAAGAEPIEITRAFRALSRATHPDHGGDRTAFEAIVAAYRTLQAAGRTTIIAAAPCAMRPAARRAAGHYRSLIVDLDRAAAMVIPTAATATARPAVRVAGPAFADVLATELRRVAA